jgi:hypothetical protein
MTSSSIPEGPSRFDELITQLTAPMDTHSAGDLDATVDLMEARFIALVFLFEGMATIRWDNGKYYPIKRHPEVSWSGARVTTADTNFVP